MKKFLIILSILMSPFISLSSSSAGEVLLHTFVNTHARFFEAQAERYKKEVDPNFNLTIVEVPYGQLYDQVTASLASGGLGAPDIVDMEQGAFGRFLMGGDPGFVDMNSLRTSACSIDDFVSSRLSLYTWKGITYGYEHALTPVVYYYHTEPFEKAGIKYNKVSEWMTLKGYDNEAQKCMRMYHKLKSGGNIMRKTTEIPKDYIGAFVGHMPSSLTHPDEDRYLTIRECLAIMKLPGDFILQGGKKNLNMICQNVPVTTAMDMAEVVSSFVAGRLDNQMLDTKFAIQCNKTKSIDYQKSPVQLDQFMI